MGGGRRLVIIFDELVSSLSHEEGVFLRKSVATWLIKGCDTQILCYRLVSVQIHKQKKQPLYLIIIWPAVILRT